MIVGERDMGDARLNYKQMIYEWFDYWLKGDDKESINKMAHVQYYTMGSNTWQSSETWPPENAEMTTYFLNSKGQANSLWGDGILTKIAFSPTRPTGSTT